MTTRQAFDERARAIEGLVRTLEAAPDAGLRATARELVQALMALHAAGLERVMQLADEAGEPGTALIDRFAEDDILKQLLLLHGLHPVDLQTRVHQALEKAQPSLQAHGGAIERVAIGETGAVQVTLREENGHGAGCGSPGQALKGIVEEAIYEAAPDATPVTIDVSPAHAPAAAFVPLGSVRRRNPDGSVASTGGDSRMAYP